MRHQERKLKRKRNIKKRKAKINHVILRRTKSKVRVKKKRKTKRTRMGCLLPSHQEYPHPMKEERENDLTRCHSCLELRKLVKERPALQRSTMVLNVLNQTQMLLPALPQPKRTQVEVGPLAVTVKKMADHHLNVPDHPGVAPHHHVSSEDTTVMNLADHDVLVVDLLVEETATIGVTGIKSHAVDPTLVALSVPQRGAVLTAVVAIATQTVTVTTVMKNVATDQEDPPLTQTTRGVIVAGLTDDITPPLPLRTLVLAHVLTVVENIIIGDTSGVVVAALVAVVEAAVLAPIDAAATVVAEVLQVVHLAPLKVLHIVMVIAGDLTVPHEGVISTGHAFTVLSLRGQLPAHSPETRTLHQHKQLGVAVELPQKREEVLQNTGIHSQLGNSWRKSNLEKKGVNLELAPS